MLGLNVKSAFFAARAVAPHLRAVGGGAIVNVASISALRPVGSNLAYNASKAAMVSLTQSLAVALGPSGIRVNAVAPGHIETRWHAGRDAAAAASRERTPLGRNGSPDDVGGAVEYLATAPWITGEVIVVDGGRFLR
ncbi:MAG: SDR family oxidoreductase [Proteobacteria bacterium]|nr:SDR family oxidoreductase [Pseudomonadota bacterium]